jgi:competence protein ComEC
MAAGQGLAGGPRRIGAWLGPLAVVMVLLLAGVAPLLAGSADGLDRLAGAAGGTTVRLVGRLLEDPRPFRTVAPGPGAPSPETAIPTPSTPAAPSPAPAAGCRALFDAGRGRTELVFRPCPQLRAGWRLEVGGQLRRPRSAPHPFLAGPAERLARQGIHSELRVDDLRVLERPASPIADLRRRIADRFVAAAGPEVGGLLAALVLGSAVVTLPDALTTDFRIAGLSHALAASGFHLTVLLGTVLAVARSWPSLARLPLAVGAIVLFLLLAGPQPSVVRAVISGALALLAREAGRRGRPLGLLALTVVVMLLARPMWWADLGFQLSVAATAGLLVSAPALERWLAGPTPGRWRRLVAVAVAIPLSASLWTLPLQLLQFGVVPLYALPANLAADPLLTPLTLGAMAMAVVALVAPPLLAPLAWLLAWPSRLLLLVAHGMASLPMAQWQTGRPEPLLVLLLSLGLLGLLVPPLAQRWRHPALLLLLAAVVLHGAALRADQLLLVHQGSSDLLVVRHAGRAALVASRSDGWSCHQARRLAQGLGVEKFDWLLLLDGVPPPDPLCWSRQAGLTLANGEAGIPLAAGQRLASEGLAVEALSLDSQALMLSLGPRRWLLLPDRQAYRSWRSALETGEQGQLAGALGRPAAVWLGFQPHGPDRRLLLAQRAAPVWISGPAPGAAPLPRGWHATGPSGSLATAGG